MDVSKESKMHKKLKASPMDVKEKENHPHHPRDHLNHHNHHQYRQSNNNEDENVMGINDGDDLKTLCSALNALRNENKRLAQYIIDSNEWNLNHQRKLDNLLAIFVAMSDTISSLRLHLGSLTDSSNLHLLAINDKSNNNIVSVDNINDDPLLLNNGNKNKVNNAATIVETLEGGGSNRINHIENMHEFVLKNVLRMNGAEMEKILIDLTQAQFYQLKEGSISLLIPVFFSWIHAFGTGDYTEQSFKICEFKALKAVTCLLEASKVFPFCFVPGISVGKCIPIVSSMAAEPSFISHKNSLTELETFLRSIQTSH